jgi:hypothetical protein
MLRAVHADLSGETPVPWHTAFVHHVGYWCHFDDFYRCLELASAGDGERGLAAFAEERGVLREAPEDGDLFLVWSPVRKQFVRTGIVLKPEDLGVSIRGVPYQECITIEANTDEGRAAVARRQRQVIGEGQAFAVTAERLLPALRRAARAFARSDWQLAQDMEQEALIELWAVDATRFGEADEKLLTKLLFNRMKFVRRREIVDSLAKRRANVDPDEVTEEGVVQRSVEVRRRVEREVG